MAEYTSTIVNLSPIQQAGWVTLCVPHHAEAPYAFLSDDGGVLPTVRGPDLGKHSTVYYVYASVRGGGAIKGRIAPHDGHPTPTFSPSEWVKDNLYDVAPMLMTRTSAASQFTVFSWRPHSQTGAVSVFRGVAVSDGLVVTAFMRIATNADVVEWGAWARWSDPRTPDMQRTFDRIALQFGEIPVVDDVSFRVEINPNGHGHLVHLIDGPTTIGDGQGLTPVRGALLCTPEGVTVEQLLRITDTTVQARISNMAARTRGRLVALCASWDGHALAFGHVPNIANNADVEAAIAADHMGRKRGHWDFRPRAQPLNANQTGSQAEFGAIEATELWRGDARALDFLLWNASDAAIRPFHFCESDGKPVRKVNHPDWWTWSQRTHWSASQSPDRLGKPHPEPWFETHGWKCEDEEHVCSNLLAAVYAMTGDPILGELIQDEITVEEANVRLRSGTFGAARALGRRLHAGVIRYIVTGDNGQLDVVNRTILDAYDSWAWRDANNPVRPLATIEAATYLRDENGNPVPSVSVWEHGLAAMGLQAVVSAYRRGKLPLNEQSLSAACRLLASTLDIILTYGSFVEGGTWKLVEMFRYNDGIPVPELYYTNGGNPNWVKVSNMFEAWTWHAAVWLANQRGIPTMEHDSNMERLVSRATDITREIARTSDNTTRDRAEWFATGRIIL